MSFVSNSLGYVSDKNWQNLMKSDSVITNTKRAAFFSQTQCRLDSDHYNHDH